MTLKAGIICDLHIGHNPFENKVTTRDFLKIQRDSLLEQLTFFREKNCSHVIFAGDTFDTPFPSQEMLAVLLSCLEKFYFSYHFILGNHEIEGYKTKTKVSRVDVHALLAMEQIGKLITDINVYTEYTETELEGLPVTFMPWPRTHTDRAGLVIMHNQVSGARRDNGSVYQTGEADGFDKESAAKNNQLYISGHLHSEQWLYAFGGKSGLYYPGRWGSSRHDSGLYNRFCYIEVSNKKEFFYKVNIEERWPYWDIRRIRPANMQDIVELEKNRKFYSHVSYVIHRKDGSFIPDEQYLRDHTYIRVIEEIKPPVEVAKDIVSTTTNANFMLDYTRNFIDRYRDTVFKKPMMRQRFEKLQKSLNKTMRKNYDE